MNETVTEFLPLGKKKKKVKRHAIKTPCFREIATSLDSLQEKIIILNIHSWWKVGFFYEYSISWAGYKELWLLSWKVLFKIFKWSARILSTWVFDWFLNYGRCRQKPLSAWQLCSSTRSPSCSMLLNIIQSCLKMLWTTTSIWAFSTTRLLHFSWHLHDTKKELLAAILL